MMEGDQTMRKLILAGAIALTSTLALAQATPVDGTVTKIDTAQNKITLKHGPIKNLGMDPMTMVFAAGDPGMLKALKVGDKVLFEADRVNGRITITKLMKK
jgi:Cu(I)/Ag(I) efflux system periplasmic protein CusF